MPRVGSSSVRVTCEHVIDATATLAELIFGQAPRVHILATSREALRVEGEHAHWLRPLASPPEDAPELLRVRSEILLAMPQPDESEAERNLLHALALARRQGAKGWEHRTTMTFAQLRTRQGREVEARDALSNIYAQFTEGFETRDLAAARELLRGLGTPTHG